MGQVARGVRKWSGDRSLDARVASIEQALADLGVRVDANTDLAVDLWGGRTVPELDNVKRGFESRADSLMTISDATRTFTIYPTAADLGYRLFDFGTEDVKRDPLSVTWTDVDGPHFFYFNGGTLTHATSAWDIASHLPVALLLWDATNQQTLLFAEERHEASWSASQHEYTHKTTGTRYQTGLGLTVPAGSGAADSDAKITKITSGVIWDEDIEIAITNGTGTGDFTQDLGDNGGSFAQIPIFYLDGSVWRKKDADDWPFPYTGAVPEWNKYTAPNWGKQSMTNLYHYALWLFATDNIWEPVIGVMGQRQDLSLADARKNNTPESLTLGAGFPSAEFRLIYRVLFEYKTSFANAKDIRIVEAADYRTVSTAPGTVSATIPTPATTVEDETSYDLASDVGTSLSYARADHTHGTVPSPTLEKTWTWDGPLFVDAGTLRWYPQGDIQDVTVLAAADDAPTGDDAIFDVNKNGSTVFSTQANRPTIADGDNESAWATPDDDAASDGDYYQIDVDQVGSTSPGGRVTLTIRYRSA